MPKARSRHGRFPTCPEWGTAKRWTDWGSELIEIKTHPKEIVENLADKGHFGPVHGTWANDFGNEFKDHIGIQRVKGIAYPRGGGEDEFELQLHVLRPGYMLSRDAEHSSEHHAPVPHARGRGDSVHVRIGAMIDMSNVKEG